VPVNLEAAKAIQDWLEVLGTHRPDAPLFESQRKGKAIDRTQAYRILEGAYDAAGLTGKLGTHAMWKTFAHGVYEALSHKNISSTVSYLGFGTDAEVNEAILSL
jgi:site-specific recombinase XerC